MGVDAAGVMTTSIEILVMTYAKNMQKFYFNHRYQIYSFFTTFYYYYDSDLYHTVLALTLGRLRVRRYDPHVSW